MRALLILCFCLLSLPAIAGNELRQEMTTAEAYKATNVQQKTFDLAYAAMAEPEKRYLMDLFTATDLAVIERVETQTALREHDKIADNYAIINAKISTLTVPLNLYHVHQLIRDSVLMEQQYLDFLRRNGRFDAQHETVQAVHRSLLAAYAELLRLYPNESDLVKQSFYAHLCALDFI